MKSMRWMSVVAALLLAVMVGALAYNAGMERGVAQGVAQSGKIVAVPGGVPYPYPYYVGYRPWGFGFVFAPFFFFLFVAMMVRGVFGRGGWHRGRCGGNSYLDEWHRQAHERFGDAPTGTTGGGTAAR